MLGGVSKPVQEEATEDEQWPPWDEKTNDEVPY